jgi:hypothetical protein
VTRHILILGGNLPGLITAYRLIPYGFRITILGHQRDIPPVTSPHPSSEPAVSRNRFSRLCVPYLPLNLHAYYYSTWCLLQELEFEQPPRNFHGVDLEFTTSAGTTIPLSQARWLSTLHPIIRLALFSGLAWPDRWRLINFLEKKWEGHFPPDPHSDTLTVESWLLSAGQSALAIQTIWNPLCRFFLACDTSQASLGLFLEVLSRFWLLKSRGPEILLTSPNFLDHVQETLTRVLVAKGVEFSPSHDITGIHADTNRIQTISLANGERLTADAYVSTLAPPDLLRLLPERAPARFSCFSHLAHLQEDRGTAVQFLVNRSPIPARLILNTGLFDWVISQTIADAPEQQSLITCVNLQSFSSQTYTDYWLKNTAWPHIQDLLTIFSGQSPADSEPQVFQSAYTYIPCLTGFRTFRPLSGTPIPNLFLSGPWTATQLPPCLESTVISANACARTLSECLQTPSH